MIRILIADDHAIVRQGIRQLLGLAEDLEVVDEARDGWEVIEQLRRHDVDLLIIDISMPGPQGVELVKRVKDEQPRLPILAFTMHDESQIAARVLRAGAAGYLTKDCEPEELIAAVRKVARGGRCIAPAMAEKLVFETAVAGDAPRHELLSDREYEVFLRLAHGASVNDIADELHLSAKTVSTHKTRLMQKLGVESTAELVRYAITHQLAR